MVTGQVLSDCVLPPERAQDQHVQQLPVLLGEPQHPTLGAARSSITDLHISATEAECHTCHMPASSSCAEVTWCCLALQAMLNL